MKGIFRRSIAFLLMLFMLSGMIGQDNLLMLVAYADDEPVEASGESLPAGIDGDAFAAAEESAPAEAEEETHPEAAVEETDPQPADTAEAYNNAQEQAENADDAAEAEAEEPAAESEAEIKTDAAQGGKTSADAGKKAERTPKVFSHAFAGLDDSVMLLALLRENGVNTAAVDDASVTRGDAANVELLDYIGDYLVVPNASFDRVVITADTREGERYEIVLSCAVALEKQTVPVEMGETELALAGLMPAEAEVSVTAIDTPKGVKAQDSVSFDITINDGFQPEEPITITVSDPKIGEMVEAGMEIIVIHVADDGTLEPLQLVRVEGDTVTFLADHFSGFDIGGYLFGTLTSWVTEAFSFAVRGLRGLTATYTAVSVTADEGLEVLGAWNVKSSGLLSGLSSLWLDLNKRAAIELAARESLDVYAVNNGQLDDVLIYDVQTDESVELSDAKGFALVRDSGYRHKSFELDAVSLDGMMPKDADAEAEDASESTAVQALEGELLAAYEINLTSDGAEYQPDAGHPIQVEISNAAITKDHAASISLWHIRDDGTKEEISDFTVEDGKLSFVADSFSVYAITDDITPRIFYTFYNGTTALATEYVTTIEEFYDPGVTPDYGQTFIGWAYNHAESDESNMLTWDQLKTDLAAKIAAGGYPDGETVGVYAKFKEAYYLRYMFIDDDGMIGVLKSDSVRTDAADKTVTVDCDYSSAGADFQGWIDVASGIKYPNGSTITLDQHIDLYAKLEGRYWLVFNANTKGATFTGPQLIYGEAVTKQPDDPTLKGYIFKGWNTKADGSGTSWLTVTYDADGNPIYSDNHFGTAINEDITLYAQWEGAPNSYYVIIWKQKVDAAGNDPVNDYEYVETVQRSGDTGDIVQIAEADTQRVYDHYEYNESISDVAAKEIDAEGTTTFNVYYDLEVYNLRFFFAREYTVNVTTSETVRTLVGNASSGSISGVTGNNNYTYYTSQNGTTRVYWRNSRFRTGTNNNSATYTGAVWQETTQNVTGPKAYLQVNNNNTWFKQHADLQSALTGWNTNDYRVYEGGTYSSNTWRTVTSSSVDALIANFLSNNPHFSFDSSTNYEQYTQSTWVVTSGGNNPTATNTSNVSVKYYYVEIPVRYGQSLSQIWPRTSSFGSAGVSTLNSYGNNDAALKNATTNLGAAIWAQVGVDKDITGNPTLLDDAFLNNASGPEIDYILYWRQTAMDSYLYEVYFSKADGSSGYELQEDLTYVAYTGLGRADIATISFDGVSYNHRDDSDNTTGTWNGVDYNNGKIKVYYDRNKHDIIFVTKDHLADGVPREDHPISNIPYGADISSYAVNGSDYYTPFNGDTTKLENGYYFEGWYVDPTCTVPYDFAGRTMPDSTITVYAKISTYRVRVVFNPNCTDFWFANNQGLRFRVDYGESVSFGNVKPGVATRPGYKLTGWYTTPDFQAGTEVNTDQDLVIQNGTPGVDMTYQASDDWTYNTYGDNDGEHDNVQGILKLYARWALDLKEGAIYFAYEVEDGYCVFDATGARQTVVPVDPLGHALGTVLQIAEAPTGYIGNVDFTNWMVLTKDGGATSVVYNANETVTLAESEWEPYIAVTNVWDEDGNVGTMKVVRLRARFTAKEDKSTAITFFGNGGAMGDGQTQYTQVVPLHATVDLGEKSAAFTRAHYTLLGWSTSPTATAPTFAANAQVFADNSTIDGLNELYAVWLPDIEIVAEGAEQEVIYDAAAHTNQEYAFRYTLGGEEKTAAELNAMGITVTIAASGWPAATGTEKGTYTARDLTDAELETLIQIDTTSYSGLYSIKRVYVPARLIIRDLMLTITKQVTGDFSNKADQFTFTLVSVEGMATGSFPGTITHVIMGTTTDTTFTIGGTFWMRDGDTVKIEGLPKGKKVVFREDNGFYQTTWTLNGGEPVAGDSTTISLTGDSTLVVTNRFDPIAPTGFRSGGHPYLLMLFAGLIILLPAVGKRRRRREDLDPDPGGGPTDAAGADMLRPRPPDTIEKDRVCRTAKPPDKQRAAAGAPPGSLRKAAAAAREVGRRAREKILSQVILTRLRGWPRARGEPKDPPRARNGPLPEGIS